MSQDNNEAASATDLPISMSTYGSLEACEAEHARRAASASQSSTPVPRVGGPDEAKPESSDLAHVARQRQESENGCARCYFLGCTCRECKESDATPSAAVAEGVDTSKMTERLAELVTAYIDMPDSVTEGQAWWNLVNFVAQRREAGRRERDEEIESFKRRCDLALSDMRAERDAALARQPVSEGLTSLTRYGWTEAYIGEESTLVEDAAGTYVKFADVQAILSAVPPAKAEGMSDERRAALEEAKGAIQNRDFSVKLLQLAAASPVMQVQGFVREGVAAIDAILAQQAKKGGAA